MKLIILIIVCIILLFIAVFGVSLLLNVLIRKKSWREALDDTLEFLGTLLMIFR